MYSYFECFLFKVRNEIVIIWVVLEVFGMNLIFLVELGNIMRYWYGEVDVIDNFNIVVNKVNMLY